MDLIASNPEKSTVGDRLNPWSSGYNFASLVPGEAVRLPASWNPFIDEQGTARGALTPFPEG
jgi:hypothetical protein